MASGYSGREEIGRRVHSRYGDDHDSSVASRRSNLSNSFMHRMSRNGLGDGGRYSGGGGDGAFYDNRNGWADDDDSGSRRGQGYVVQVRNGGGGGGRGNTRSDDGFSIVSKRSNSSSRGGDRGMSNGDGGNGGDGGDGRTKCRKGRDGSVTHSRGINAITMRGTVDSGKEDTQSSPNLLRSAD